MSVTGAPSSQSVPLAGAAPVYVVLPTYNEAANIARLVPELLRLAADLHVIVVDDASPDGTGALADTFARDFPGRVFPVHHAAKMGLGTAYLAGFQLAGERGAGSVLTMDADFSHHPSHIGAMLARLSAADLVIGSRYAPGGAAVDSPYPRRLLSLSANFISRVALGLRARDVTAGFRVYRRELLAALPLGDIFSSGYSFLIETLYLIERGGWRVAEVPIQFHDRTSGASKISRREIAKAIYTVLRLAGRRLAQSSAANRAGSLVP